MATSVTLDGRFLEHDEREHRIFPSVARLELGGRIEVIFEADPAPFLRTLQALSGFEVECKRGGPDEWTVAVTRVANSKDARGELRMLLAGTRAGESAGRALAAPPHPVHTFTEEHKAILEMLKTLRALLSELRDAAGFADLGGDFCEKLEGVVRDLLAGDSHHQREEEVLFPRLREHGVLEEADTMEIDHAEFRYIKHGLLRAAEALGAGGFEPKRVRICELGGALIRELERHIAREEGITYPKALQVLSEEEWASVRQECDRIGYCPFTPGFADQGHVVVDLDLRLLPIKERHERIFAVWETLLPGQVLRIVNDHDPKPLRYELEAESAGRHRWECEQQGPEDWAVRVTRL